MFDTFVFDWLDIIKQNLLHKNEERICYLFSGFIVEHLALETSTQFALHDNNTILISK